jgi:hypothetical protein
LKAFALTLSAHNVKNINMDFLFPLYKNIVMRPNYAFAMSAPTHLLQTQSIYPNAWQHALKGDVH